MRPAFSSTKAAAVFALLLLLLLALPAVMGKNLLPPREQAYAIQGWGLGPYPWIQNQIFEETNAIDIVFLGSSHIICGIDTPYVQQQLGEKIRSQAVVRTLGWGGSGYDGLYLVTQDLLQHRKVKLLVFYDEKVEGGELGRNCALTSLFRFGEQASVISGLPLKDQAFYYFAALIGMPKTLLSLIRPNLPAELFSDRPGFIKPEKWESALAPANLGANPIRRGFKLFSEPEYPPFAPYQPTLTDDSSSSLYSPSSRQLFDFSSTPLPAWHVGFARRFAALAKAHGCQLVLLNIPVYDERRSAVIQQRAFWPDLLSANVWMLGIPPAKMFGGLTDEEVRKLYYDPLHLNQNGQEYFTRLIMPALFKIYETSTNH